MWTDLAKLRTGKVRGARHVIVEHLDFGSLRIEIGTEVDIRRKSFYFSREFDAVADLGILRQALFLLALQGEALDESQGLLGIDGVARFHGGIRVSNNQAAAGWAVCSPENIPKNSVLRNGLRITIM